MDDQSNDVQKTFEATFNRAIEELKNKTDNYSLFLNDAKQTQEHLIDCQKAMSQQTPRIEALCIGMIETAAQALRKLAEIKVTTEGCTICCEFPNGSTHRLSVRRIGATLYAEVMHDHAGSMSLLGFLYLEGVHTNIHTRSSDGALQSVEITASNSEQFLSDNLVKTLNFFMSQIGKAVGMLRWSRSGN